MATTGRERYVNPLPYPLADLQNRESFFIHVKRFRESAELVKGKVSFLAVISCKSFESFHRVESVF